MCIFALVIVLSITRSFCTLQMKRLYTALSLSYRLKRFSISASQMDWRHCGILCIFTGIQCNVLVTFSEGGLKFQSFLLCHPCNTMTQHSLGLQAAQSLPDFGGLLKLLVLEVVFWTDQAQRGYQAWILGEHHRPRGPDMEANQRISCPNHTERTDKAICPLQEEHNKAAAQVLSRDATQR